MFLSRSDYQCGYAISTISLPCQCEMFLRYNLVMVKEQELTSTLGVPTPDAHNRYDHLLISQVEPNDR